MSPIERAAAAIERCVGIFDTTFQDDARAAFESIDVDELARALHDAACVCDGTTHPAESWAYWTNSARAVVAHLTKGDESDD